MKFLSALSLFVCAAAASPVLSARQGSSTTATFYLKTTGAENPQHNDLYVYGYHTGAGLNDAVLTPDRDTASKGFLNETHVQFDVDTPFPWGLQPIANTRYAAWLPVELNAGYGTSGFFINDNRLQWSEQNGFGGWLVCDWYHNAPQLFYIYRYYTPQYPASCSAVKLQTEPTA